MSETKYSVAFDLIARYAEQRKETPVGFRDWRIGPWRVTVNGTRETRDSIPAYHAKITHEDTLAVMLLNPMAGTVAGWLGMEDAFIDAMRSELQGEP